MEDSPIVNANQHFDQAYQYVEEDKFEQALEECDAAIAIARSMLADMYNLRGIILEELDQSEQAAGAYDKALAMEPGFQEAADNLRELEQELADQYDLVTIATFCHPTEAREMKAKLAAEGVWALMAEERERGRDALFVGHWLGIKLQVKEQETDRALAILGLGPECSESDEDEVELDEGEEVRCPDCDSPDVRSEHYSQRGIFGTWLRSRPEGRFSERKWTCRDCGYVWSVKEEQA